MGMQIPLSIGTDAMRSNPMLKTTVLTALLLAMGTATEVAANQEVTNVKVYHHNKIVRESVPVIGTYCRTVEVPIYQDVQVQGDAAGGALAGMIIGGLLGKGVSGNDDGAAAGAIMGGLIGADKGSKPKTERRIVGYETVEKCDEKRTREMVDREVYSHSTIRFYLDGKRYVVEFIK